MSLVFHCRATRIVGNSGYMLLNGTKIAKKGDFSDIFKTSLQFSVGTNQDRNIYALTTQTSKLYKPTKPTQKQDN